MKWEIIILSALKTNGDIYLAVKKAMKIAPREISATLRTLLQGKLHSEKLHLYPKIISLLYFHLCVINRDFISNSSLDDQKIPRNAGEAYLKAASISEELNEFSLQAKYLSIAADYYYEHQECNASEKLLNDSIILYRSLEENNQGENTHALASCYNNLGNTYLKTGKYSQAIESYETAVTLFETLAKKDPKQYRPLIAQATCNIGNIYINTNEFIIAKQLYEKALNLLLDLSKENPGVYKFYIATISNNLGNIYMKTGEFTAAEELYIRAIEMIQSLPQKEQTKYSSELAGFLNSLGNVYKYKKKFDKAITNYKKALASIEMFAKLDPRRYIPEISGILNNLGNIYKDINQLTEAENCYKKALKMRRKLASSHAEPLIRNVSETLDNLGDLYLRIREFRKAECALKEALEMRKTYEHEKSEKYNPLIAQTLNKLGALYYKIGNFNQSEQALLEALTINRQLAQKYPDAYMPALARTLNNLYNLYKETHNFSSAQNLSTEVLHLKEDLLHSDMDAYDYDFANTLNNLGNLSAYLRNFHDAEETYQRALHIARELSKKYPEAYIPFVADILNNLGNVYRDCKKFSQSEKNYLESLKIRRNLAKKEARAYMFPVSEILNNLGSLYFKSRKYFEAESAFKEALDIRETLADGFPTAYTRHIAHTYTHLGNLYLETERLSDAESAFKDSLNIYARLFENNSDAFTVALSIAHNDLGNFYFHSKHFVTAKKYYEKAFDIIQGLEREKLNIYDFYISRIFNNLGNIYLKLDNTSEAEKYYKKAVEKDIKTASWFDMAKTTHNISKIHSSIESLEKARKTLELAMLFSKEKKYTYMQKGGHEKIYLDFLEKELDCYTVLEALRDPDFLSIPWETILPDEELSKAQNDINYQKSLMNTLLTQKITTPEFHADLPEKSCFLYVQMLSGHIYLFILKNDTIKRYTCEDQFFSTGNNLSYMLHLQQSYTQKGKDVGSLVNKFHNISREWAQALPEDIITIIEESNQILFSTDHACSFLPLETLVLNEQPLCLEKIVVRTPSFHHTKKLLNKNPQFDSQLIVENPWPGINKTPKHYAVPPGDKEYTLTYLDGALEETESLFEIFPHATILSGHNATGQAFISDLSTHSLVHFCGHGGKGRILFLSGPFKGISPPYEPEEFTHLRQAERKEGSNTISMMEEWHPVTDIEIFDTSLLDGAVVFLNACETGQRKYAGGGHFQGLSSVLLRNGAHSVISSLYPIFDHASRDFATHFYQELLQTHSVCTSLQKARFRIKNKYGTHIYWIPYIHYGSPF